ncbi:hypothetical protein V1514DRAFT_335292 [Lipomyces japonicus]|uniref:uncharacterized protein n=1 Tax=Lipomyces japonicus TaxID=56871 RepID=UPI0034CD935F
MSSTSELEYDYVPTSNSWAAPGSASRTKVELVPYLRDILVPAADPTNDTTSRQPVVVLEVASGFGEHVAYFGQQLPSVVFQPSEAQDECVRGIAHTISSTNLDPRSNVNAPVKLNVLSPASSWRAALASGNVADPVTVILAINLLHISPFASTQALFDRGSQILPRHGKIITYGCFKRHDEFAGPGDVAFEKSLRDRDDRWGIRDLDGQVVPEASRHGFKLVKVYNLNSNNLLVVFEKQ